MASLKQCQQCGADIPSDGLSGHCPRCLVAKVLLGAEPTAGSGLAVALRQFGDYELIEEIARGGMGVVYRARQVSLNRMVALKMILGGEFATPGSVRRFRNEAEAAARLRHANIVTIHEVGERDGQHYFAMELVEGPNFAALVREGPLPARRAAGYGKAVAEGVAHAHSQRVLHRDLKPSNILLDPFDQPRVTDFGLARQLDSGNDLTLTGQTFGSPGYMSPEQAAGRHGEISEASDIYSLGAVLYHLLTGRPPFQGGSIPAVLHQVATEEPVALRRLNPSVPVDLETIALKCLDKDPARRYGSAGELAEEFGRFLRDEPIEARPLSQAARLWRWMRRHPAVAALGASVLLLLIVVAIGSTLAAWRVTAARQAEQRERTKAERANRDLVAANDRLADTVRVLEFQRAEDLLRTGDPSAAVAHFAAMLRRNPSNAGAAARLVSALAHRDWALPAAPPVVDLQPVEKASFSPDGRQILAVSRDQTARIHEVATGRLMARLSHRDRILSAAYNPDGSRLVTASADGTARVWSGTNGVPLTPPLVHQGRVNRAEFSRDGRWVLTASADRTARIWDAATGVLSREFRGHSSPIWMARFGPDGKQIATAGDGGAVRLWDVESGKELFRLANRRIRMTALEFSPDGQRLAWSGDFGGAQLWDTATGAAVGGILAHRRANETVWSVAFSPDSQHVLTTCQDGTTRLWSASDGQFQGESQAHEGGVSRGVFSPEGGRVATASMDNSARVWDLARNGPVCQPLREHERVLDVSFSPDGRQLLTASYNSVVQVWDIRERHDAGHVVADHLAASMVAFSPDGESLAVLTRDRGVRILDARPGRKEPRAAIPAQGVQSAELSPNGEWVATGATNGLVQLWEMSTGRLRAELAGHAQIVRSIRFSPDGRTLATASADGTARLWEMPGGRPIGPPLVHRAEILMVRFSPDGRRVATASEDWSARVWDASSGVAVTEGLSHIDHVKSVDFSPDGERLVTGSTDNTACIWSVATGRTLTPRLRHARIVERALFSPDGRRVATASIDRTVRVWDAASGQAITEPLVHDSAVSHLAWSPDGRRLLSASWNGLARLWDPDNGQPLTEWLPTGGGAASVCLDSTGRWMASAASRSGDVRVWAIPTVPVPVPSWFAAFAETVGGLRLTTRGHVELVSRQELNALVAQLGTPESLPGGFYENFARWFLDDPERRGAFGGGGQ